MPSAPVADFLELARGLRLLPDADLDQLAADPTTPADPSALCDHLVSAGQLTRYQATRLLTGRGYTLTFAGFVLLDEVGEGTFRALAPAERAEVLLRRFPGGSNAERARVAGATRHANLGSPLLAGERGGEGYTAHPPPAGADFAALVADMGPMPALLAAEYTRQAAVGLVAAHAAGVVHGGIRAERLFVGPLVQASRPKPDGSPRFRPAPTSAVVVGEFGVPLPNGAGATPAGDVFDLGGVLFHLLTGKPPGETSLTAARPDCPPDLTALVKGMLALAPADRPTMAEVLNRLTALIPPANRGAADGEPATVELVDEPPLALAPGWAGHPATAAAYTPPAWTPPPFTPEPAADEFAPADEPYTPRRGRSRASGGNRQMIWLLAGAFLAINVLAVLVWALVLFNPFAKK